MNTRTLNIELDREFCNKLPLLSPRSFLSLQWFVSNSKESIRMAESRRCQDLRNAYLKHIDDLGRAEPQLFRAKSAVENSLRNISTD